MVFWYVPVSDHYWYCNRQSAGYFEKIWENVLLASKWFGHKTDDLKNFPVNGNLL
jgi:hypothetical protein